MNEPFEAARRVSVSAVVTFEAYAFSGELLPEEIGARMADALERHAARLWDADEERPELIALTADSCCAGISVLARVEDLGAAVSSVVVDAVELAVGRL